MSLGLRTDFPLSDPVTRTMSVPAVGPAADVPPVVTDPDLLPVAAMLTVLRRARRLAFGLGIGAALLVIAYTLYTPRTYASEASFLPTSRKGQTPGGLAGLAEQLGVGLAGSDATQNPAFYVDLLKSRPILEQLVDARYAIAPGRAVMYTDVNALRGDTQALRREAAIARLKRELDVALAPRTGVVTVRLETLDAELSRLMLQRTLDLLNQFNQSTRRSQASAERRFTEGRLAESRAELRAAEDRVTEFLSRNLALDNSASLRAEEARLQRELSTRQGIVSTLAQAYEQARIDEVRDTPLLTVIETPERAVRPVSRGLVPKTLVALLLGMLVGVLVTLARGLVRPLALGTPAVDNGLAVA